MIEPDWSQYVIDYVFDNPAAQQRKGHEFQHAFIAWREGLKAEKAKKAKKQPARGKSSKKGG